MHGAVAVKERAALWLSGCEPEGIRGCERMDTRTLNHNTPVSLLFILYLTIMVSANTKTDTDSDKCLHNVRVQAHVCPLSLWKKKKIEKKWRN